MKDPTDKWCYSTDEENYHGRLETESDAKGEAQDWIDSDALDDGVDTAYWVAQCAHPLDCISQDVGDDILKMLLERMADEVGDDDTPIELTTEHVAQLGSMVVAFVRQNAEVKVYGIKNPVKHQYLSGSNA